jgi:hypothetical protein
MWIIARGRAEAREGPNQAMSLRPDEPRDNPQVSAARSINLLDAWWELERSEKTADRRARLNYSIPETVRSRGQMVIYARKRSVHNAPTAFVVNGEWSGPWWLTDGVTEGAAAGWDARYSALLASLPDDTLLTVIDCHVV